MEGKVKTESIDMDDMFNQIGVKVEGSEDTLQRLEDNLEETNTQVRLKVEDINKVQEIKKIQLTIPKDVREQAVLQGVIPRTYKEAEFNKDKIKANIRQQFKRNNGIYKIYKFDKYIEICEYILSRIKIEKRLPDASYIIGAPNGFGKTSFVNESLIALMSQGYRVAPYISLWELAQLRIDNEHRIMQPYKKYRIEDGRVEYYDEPNKPVGVLKNPEVVTGRYSYSEYINADCLFVHFTDVASKDIESHTLYQLLSIRGNKGLPTIVMISTALTPYKTDLALKEYVWDEIEAYSKIEGCYDRVYHISCYKRKNLSIDNKGENIEKDTGIVSSDDKET